MVAAMHGAGLVDEVEQGQAQQGHRLLAPPVVARTWSGAMRLAYAVSLAGLAIDRIREIGELGHGECVAIAGWMTLR